MEDWMARLQQREPDAAWDALLTRYRRLIFAAIRHYAQDYDDVMDVFTRVCEALREDDLRRLRGYIEQPEHRDTYTNDTFLYTSRSNRWEQVPQGHHDDDHERSVAAVRSTSGRQHSREGPTPDRR